MRQLLSGIVVLLFLAAVKVSPVQALPEGFAETLVAEVSAPTDLEWTPDGRILIAGKSGLLSVIQNGVLLPTPAIDLSSKMCDNGERGLGGVAVHPDFVTNNYIYLYYTFNKINDCAELSDSNAEGPGPVNRLSRFTLPPSNVIDPASEVVLFDTAPLFRDHHNGGDILFGTDGLIYVTVGDGGTRRFDWPQDPGRILGKVVRVTDTGGIPPDNPYTGADSARCNVDGVPPAGSTATKCQEVFSIGLRNPFRMALDTNATTTRFYINDVGQHTWEDISEGPVNGGNYGWPQYEGPCVTDSTTDCDPQPGLIDPVHWDPHGVDGAAITGGAFVPNGVWPAAYDGTYLYADYVFGKIYQLTPGAAGCRLCDPPTSNFNKIDFADAESIVAMAFGPYEDTQALYYVTRGSTDGLFRIAFTGDLNRSPTAVISATPTSGPPPLEVQFSGLGSSDPDGDPLTYAWDFEGDDAIDSTDASPIHTYTGAGTYFAELTVNDGQGGQHTASVRIDVDNTPPVPVIETPGDGTTFAVGDVFTLHGSATDAEDGTLADSALTWEVRQHHATHFHPFLDETTGNDIVLQPAPEPEDLTAATNSYLEVRLTATDSTGLSTTVSRIINPRKVTLSFDSVPSGLSLVLDTSTVTTPINVVSWEAHNLEVQAPNQTPYEWLSWSDGGAQTHSISVPPSSASYVATFTQPGAPAVLDLIAPAGVISHGYGNPMYQWSHVGATHYDFYVGQVTSTGLKQILFERKLAASTYCNDNVCSIEPTVLNEAYRLLNGTYNVWLRGYNNGSAITIWRGPYEFRLNAPPPALPTPGAVTNYVSTKPTFNWTVDGSAAFAAWFNVQIYAVDKQGNAGTKPIQSTWHRRADTCGSADGTACNVVSVNDLPTANYYVVRMRSYGPGGWSNGNQISLTEPVHFNVGGEPGKSPASIVSDPRQGRPLIAWDDDLDDTTDTQWVQIWIGGNGHQYSRWHKRDGANLSFTCAAGRCYAEPNINWTAGTYQVWMRTWGPGGYSLPMWVQGPDLTLPGQAPAVPSGLAVSGTNSNNPIFSWNSVANATWYQVVLEPSSANWSYGTWHLGYDLGAACGDATGTCTWTDPKLDGKLPLGDYVFRVKAWGPGGPGQYSAHEAFTYSGP